MANLGDDTWQHPLTEGLRRAERLRRYCLRGLGLESLRVVWECELVGQTVETVRRVASWLRQGADAEEASSGGEDTVDRMELLTVAEEKVRYRIDSYEDKPRAGVSVANEG